MKIKPKINLQKDGLNLTQRIWLLAAVLLTIVSSSFAQTNPYKAPLYWNPYEYNIIHDGYIPESEWASNINWVEANLKPYGYNMICIDGWGDDAKWNQDGYRTTHSSNWTHDYAYWSANLQSRGMTLGIYNNPLWVIKAAADAGVKIKGTNIPLSNIINTAENATWFTWVQVNNAGAEQYVKGYIQYYADMGVKFLRVDFLSWFEDGFDKGMNPTRVGVNRPHADYVTALRWMREACDANGMFLSLVMPHLKNEAQEEKVYGHMFRINEDAGLQASWSRWNNNERGIRHNWWSQYYNAVDGYTYWSYLAGRGKVILDGDFIRLNTFANDDERRSVISLNLMAGGPISVADQYNSVGSNLQFYQNTEMLALNTDKFAGRPLTNDPTNTSSQIWTGQMSNGDWVVGLFNREDNAQTRSIDFATNLGFSGNATVRNLWTHSDLGTMTSYSVSVPAHGCVILKVVPTGTTTAVAPVFSPAAGTYSSAQSVSLASTTSGATIRYTTDGSIPTSASSVYSGPINVSTTTTIKAFASATGMNNSTVSTGVFTINIPVPPPSPWVQSDIGTVGVAGTGTYSSGSFTAAGSGADIEGAADAFHYIYQPITGDVTVTAKIESQTNTNSWAKAGVMIRETLNANSINAFTAITPSNGVTFQRRTTAGGGTTATLAGSLSTPIWLRIQRTGNNITSYRSTDGSNWTQIGTAVSMAMASQVYIGLAVTSHANTVLSTAVFSNVTIVGGTVVAPTFTPAAGTYTTAQSVTISSTTPGATIRYTTDGSTPTASSAVYASAIAVSGSMTIKAYASSAGMTDSPVSSAAYTINLGLPSPWLHTDVGTVTPAGSATYSAGSFTNKGAGADIEGTSDAFHYIYYPVVGDVTITAKVTSLVNTNAWAKAGVMIRETLNANSINLLTAITPSNGASFQRRTTTGGGTTGTISSGVAVPYWLRISRTGNSVAGYRSADGTTWTQIGTSQSVAMASQVYVGLATTSHLDGTLTTAIFSNVSVTTSSGTTNYRASTAGEESIAESTTILYPNPADQFVILDLSSFGAVPVQVRIVNVAGQTLHDKETIGGSKHEVDISSFAAGCYIVKVNSGNTRLSRMFMIKK